MLPRLDRSGARRPCRVDRVSRAIRSIPPKYPVSQVVALIKGKSAILSLPETQIRAYRWCNPPRIGYPMSPNRSTARVLGASFLSET
jgi:hypothetical protein